MVPVPIAAITNGFRVGVKTAASLALVEGAIYSYPQIGRYFFPRNDGAKDQLIAISALKTQLGGLLQEVQNKLNSTLVSVMTNYTEFSAFAAQGNFTSSAPSLADQSNNLLYGFNTYLVSTALAGEEVHAVLALDTNPQQLATNGSDLAYDIGCDSYNEQGICGQWWWDSEANIAYGLDDFRHMNRDMNSILTTILSKYTTGEMLFRNAYACNLGGGYGQPVNVTVNAAGVNTACLSQLEIRRWDMSCRQNKVNSPCEFIDGPIQKGWMDPCGSHSAWMIHDTGKYCVPKSYLGPLIRQKQIVIVNH